MLPTVAETHYRQELARVLADAAGEFASRLERFDRSEQQRGGAFGGAGYAARLANEYVGELELRSAAISQLLGQVHEDFESPLDDGIEEQLAGWGLAALNAQWAALRGAYSRHLRSFGMPVRELSASPQVAAQQASVQNRIRSRLWSMRNVPMKHPSRRAHPSLVVNGPVGVVQYGDHATANVQQSESQTSGTGAEAALQAALAELTALLKEWPQIDASMRVDAIKALEDVRRESTKERPDKGKVGALLSSIGTLIQTIPAAPQAWATIRQWWSLLGG